MAPMIYLITFASFWLIVVNGQDNVSEQLREIKESLRERDALYQQQQHQISGIADDLQTLTGAMERYIAGQTETLRRMDVVEDGQAETLRRMDALDQQQKNHSSLMEHYLIMLEDGQRDQASCPNVTTSHEEVDLPSDCADIQRRGQTQSGVYTLQHSCKPLQVYCDLVTDGGGWLVFQRRQDGSVDFYRNWTQYESGFGDVNTEFWLGNTYLHSLTSTGTYQLRVDMEYFDGEKLYAVYDSFSVGSTEDKYRLRIGAYQGTAGDSLTYHNRQRFSTHDQDNDVYHHGNCASYKHGAGWYRHCATANPNGRYYHSAETATYQSIYWDDFRQLDPPKHLEMKLRPSDF